MLLFIQFAHIKRINVHIIAYREHQMMGDREQCGVCQPIFPRNI